MIYLFSGPGEKRQPAYLKLLGNLPKGTEIFRVEKSNWNPLEMERFYTSSGLFFDKIAVILSEVLENPEAKNFIIEKLSEIGESKNSFIFLESKLPKAIIDAFKSARAQIEVFEREEPEEKYDNFLLAGALGKKDSAGSTVHSSQRHFGQFALERFFA